MLGLLQVEEHEDGQGQEHDDVDGVAMVENLRQPTNLGGAVDGVHGGVGALPGVVEIVHDFHGDVVHHQSKQGFIRSPLCFEESRNQTPNGAGQKAGGKHQDIKQWSGYVVAQVMHNNGCGNGADQDLAFCTNVPEFHFECRSQSNGNSQQLGGVNGGVPAFNSHTGGVADFTEGSLEHLGKGFAKANAGNGVNEQTTD